MPRFENLKGSMNPFSNNRPRLTASERIRNKRDATIYQAEKSKYQASRKCYNGGKNIKYYKNGTVKSTINHEMNQKLARGAVLCEDCNHQGLVCASTLKKNNFAKVNLGNSSISSFNLGTGLTFSSSPKNATRVIVTDISGSWNDPSGRVECQPGPPPLACYFPYGYADNLITVPRNLDGSGITIDPDNILFNQDDNCNTFKIPKPKYLKFMGINTYIVYEGILADARGFPLLPENSNGFEGPTSSNIYSVDGSNNYTDLLNKYVIVTFNECGVDDLQAPWPITGIIEKICVTKKKITIANAAWNAAPLEASTSFPPWPVFPATLAPFVQTPGGPQYFEADVFKMFIGIQYINPDAVLWQGTIYRSNCVNQTIPQASAYNSAGFPGWIDLDNPEVPACAVANFKPSYPNPGFVIRRLDITQPPFGPKTGAMIVNSAWAGDATLISTTTDLGTIQSWSYRSRSSACNGTLLGSTKSAGYNASPMTVGLGQFKLSSGCSEPQVRQNKTRQSYLSCIEQGTKNIKFTKNTL